MQVDILPPAKQDKHLGIHLSAVYETSLADLQYQRHAAFLFLPPFFRSLLLLSAAPLFAHLPFTSDIVTVASERAAVPAQCFVSGNVWKRNPLPGGHASLHRSLQVLRFVGDGKEYIRCQGVSAYETSYEANSSDTLDDGNIIPSSMPSFVRRIYIPTHVIILEGYIFVDRDDPIIPACGIAQDFCTHK